MSDSIDDLARRMSGHPKFEAAVEAELAIAVASDVASARYSDLFCGRSRESRRLLTFAVKLEAANRHMATIRRRGG